MLKEKEIHAILFADIAQSTQMYERHGDTLTQKLIAGCFELLNGVIKAHHGRLIKTIGDEIMCVFPTALDALEAARKMPEAMEKVSIPGVVGHAITPSLYIGIHFGSVIAEQGDIFGDAVNVAARMVSLAKQHQIIVTQKFVEALPPDYQDCVRCIDKMKVKGKAEDMLIYEVLCHPENVTLMLQPTLKLRSESVGCLELRVHKKIITVNETDPVKTLGRQSQNDIVIEDHRVSRTHARLEYRKGKFFLVDQSTNGTYVVRYGFDPVLLRRDEMLLQGSGFIGLHDEVTAVSPHAIHFSIKEVLAPISPGPV